MGDYNLIIPYTYLYVGYLANHNVYNIHYYTSTTNEFIITYFTHVTDLYIRSYMQYVAIRLASYIQKNFITEISCNIYKIQDKLNKKYTKISKSASYKNLIFYKHKPVS